MVLERYDKGNMVLKRVRQPKAEILEPVPLSDFTMEERRKNLLRAMEEEQIDCLIIYGDLEHGSNFEYLTGFLPRFEEALAETGVQENDRVTVTPARIKKLESRSFKTESGIEIRIPAELCSSDDAVEFIHSATGGLSLLIKDVLV